MRLCFVLPRFGEKIYGGAEFLMTALARKLSERGEQIQILSTCAIDNRSWENYFPAGVSHELGLDVIRFPVDTRDLDSWIPKQIAISEGFRLSVEDQLDWMQHSVNSSAMYEYILKHQKDFDYFFFAPYLFGTTFWGSLICPERSILFPCLHDETQAYTDVVAAMFKRVRACMFNANAERDLAQALYGQLDGGEVGLGFDLPDPNQVFQPYFKETFPYVLCLGRKETGKNAQLLIDDFIKAKKILPELQDLRLVIAGGGSFSDLHRDDVLSRGDIVDVQAPSELEKQQLIAHSLCLCNPSVNESFSIVIMEAWMLQRPVVVNAKCAVTREHVTASEGGLYFQDEKDLAAVLRVLVKDPELAQTFGVKGYNYVATRYNWSAVVDRFYEVLKNLSL
jgi:glycosyltransferase involved in cell wall biosynthesis